MVNVYHSIPQFLQTNALWDEVPCSLVDTKVLLKHESVCSSTRLQGVGEDSNLNYERMK
jgi:hypothetical protein